MTNEVTKMGMPEQVRKQVEDVQQYYESQQEESSAQPDDARSEGAVEQEPTQAAEVVSISQAQKPQEPQPANAPEADATLLQQYRSLQGMFNSQTTKYREALAQIDHLRSAIETLQAAPQPAASALTGFTTPTTGVTENELQEYTPEFFGMLDRWLAPRIAWLEQQLQSVARQVPAVQSLTAQVGQVAAVQHRTAEQMFFDALTKRVPTWEAINNSTAFIQWLGQVDPLTGVSKQVYLDDARSRLDLERVVSIFNAFQEGSTSAGKNTSKSANAELAAQAVVPSRRQGSTPSSSPSERVFTKADLERLYQDYRRGVYKGRDAEFREKEAELLAAISSGRYHR